MVSALVVVIGRHEPKKLNWRASHSIAIAEVYVSGAR